MITLANVDDRIRDLERELALERTRFRGARGVAVANGAVIVPDLPRVPPFAESLATPAVWPVLIEKAEQGYEFSPALRDLIPDMRARHELGMSRYGVPLRPFNGRNALQDALEEALDLAVYLYQAYLELPEPPSRGQDRHGLPHIQAVYTVLKLALQIKREMEKGKTTA